VNPIGASDGSVLDDVQLALPGRREGKVRISWELPDDRLLFVTTDRLSAFDKVLALVPGKGQVLNELAWWWFQRLSRVVSTHALALPDPNVLVAKRTTPLPIEVIVRGAITGVTTTSIWKRYEAGQRVIDGHRFPDGLTKNSLLPTPIITPTTKAELGGHDEPLSCTDVVTRGLLDANRWEEVMAAAHAVFAIGQETAAAAGLVLADTKYEFGIDRDGTLVLIDEVHTPDSSRFWNASTYQARIFAGQEPESMDKEIIRIAYAERGYRGDGPIPELPSQIWALTAQRYRDLFERLTGTAFLPGPLPIAARIQMAVAHLDHDPPTTDCF
jgi:phosphoribosylaminoimidazole-succinocarboxamide synthase